MAKLIATEQEHGKGVLNKVYVLEVYPNNSGKYRPINFASKLIDILTGSSEGAAKRLNNLIKSIRPRSRQES